MAMAMLMLFCFADCCIGSFHVFCSFVVLQVTVFFYGTVEDFMFCWLLACFLVCHFLSFVRLPFCFCFSLYVLIDRMIDRLVGWLILFVLFFVFIWLDALRPFLGLSGFRPPGAGKGSARRHQNPETEPHPENVVFVLKNGSFWVCNCHLKAGVPCFMRSIYV